jgi:N-acetylglucosaminyldiphosphoundecaprenol N-acetyl-beta-D-mannosaminyltransferase
MASQDVASVPGGSGLGLELEGAWAHACPIDDIARSTWVNRVRLNPHGPAELPGLVASLLRCGHSHVVHFLPAHPIVLAEQDEAYRTVLNRGDLNLVDGASVAVAILFQGQRTARTTGSDALAILPPWGVGANLKHYLYGGSPEVVGALQERLEEEHPGLDIVGAESPPFRDLSHEELAEAAARIRDAGTDLLWVGLGTPKQDLVAERLRALDAAPVILCVGAAFDFAARIKRRAPGWMQAIGAEWLFRLATEPRRLWRRYLIGNAQFVAAVASDYKRPGPGRRE